MIIKEVEFIGSFEQESQCPKDGLPEYAFIGRSNVGKSSLINMLLGRKEIARISSTPGKTQTLNYYLINKECYIVDLPGYGYAKISKAKRKKWRLMIESFIQTRQTLACLFCLLDGRHKLQKIDLEFLDYLGSNSVAFVIAYTKLDKVKQADKDQNIMDIKTELLEYWHELPQQFETSSLLGTGRQEILDFMEQINNNSRLL